MVVAQTPVAPRAAGDEVTQAALSVLTDPTDTCVLHLSGTLAANRDTEATCRIIDPCGRRSGNHNVQLEADLPTFVHHEFDIPTIARTGHDAPGLDDEAGGPVTGKISDTFQLEVTSPNTVLSNVDGFNVAPWPRGPVFPRHRERRHRPVSQRTDHQALTNPEAQQAPLRTPARSTCRGTADTHPGLLRQFSVRRSAASRAPRKLAAAAIRTRSLPSG